MVVVEVSTEAIVRVERGSQWTRGATVSLEGSRRSEEGEGGRRKVDIFTAPATAVGECSNVVVDDGCRGPRHSQSQRVRISTAEAGLSSAAALCCRL